MVIVEEQHEEPHVGPRRLTLLVVVRPDGGRRPVLVLRDGVDLDDREALDRLRLAIFGDGEVLGLQVEHRLSLAVGHDHIDADEIDAGPDRLLGSLGLLAALLCLSLR